MEANSKKHCFRKGRSATFSIDGFNITIGKDLQARQSGDDGAGRRVFACQPDAQICVHDGRREHVGESEREAER